MILAETHHRRRGTAGYDKWTPEGIACLFGAFCVHLMVGSQYAWGSMVPYMVGYYRQVGNLDSNMSQFYIVLPLIVITSTLFFPIGMKLAGTLGSRLVILIGGCITFTTCFMASYTQSTTLFFMLYALGFGAGKGFLYPAPLKAGWSHFSGRKGLVSGIIVSGLGIGAFIFGNVVTLMVNPDNKPPVKTEIAPGVYEYYFPADVNARVPETIRALCMMWGALIFLGVMTVSNFKESPVEEQFME